MMVTYLRPFLMLLLLSFIGVNMPRSEAQENPPSDNDIPSVCHPMPFTKYQQFGSDWRWQDADTLVFSASPGNLTNGIFTNPIVWYQYHPSTNQLEELKGDPYLAVSEVSPLLTTLNDVQADGKGSFRTVAISPMGDAFVYPRTSQMGGGYWYFNSRTGTQIDLGIPTTEPIYVPLETIWSAHAERFILQNGSNI